MAILAAILDFSVTSRSNLVKKYFIGFTMLQNMGVEPISCLYHSYLQSYGHFSAFRGGPPWPPYHWTDFLEPILSGHST